MKFERDERVGAGVEFRLDPEGFREGVDEVPSRAHESLNLAERREDLMKGLRRVVLRVATEMEDLAEMSSGRGATR